MVWLAVFCVVANKQSGKVTFKLAAKSERGRRLTKSANYGTILDWAKTIFASAEVGLAWIFCTRHVTAGRFLQLPRPVLHLRNETEDPS